MKSYLKAAAVAGAAFFVGGAGAGTASAPLAARPPQAWLARRFLLRMLANRPGPAAYAALDPGARPGPSGQQLAARAARVRREAQRWGPAIELYKLGWRLPEGRPALLFYQFRFAADSARLGPHVVLDVTFRDSLATRPLGFGVVPLGRAR